MPLPLTFFEVFERLAAIPTAPYREAWMCAGVERLLAEMPGVVVRRDRWGNIAARLRRGHSAAPPVAFVAHLDHPGFVVTEVRPDGAVAMTFEGYVEDPFFAGEKVRLFRSKDDAGVLADLEYVEPRTDDADRNRHALGRPHGDARGAVLAMWDLPAVERDGSLLRSRAVDDPGGAAAMLAALARLSQRTEPVDVIMLFTRAEETGFRGALLLCMDHDREQMVPNDSVVISVETSSQRATARVGGGAVLRIGDKTTVFDPEMCRALEFASKAAAKNAAIRPLVRALMDGGTCEATAFNQFGYRAAGLCVPLGNYHNMNHDTGRIEPEYIDLADANDLTAAIESLPLLHTKGPEAGDNLKERLIAMAENAKPKLQ